MAELARDEISQWQAENEQLRTAVQQLRETEQYQKQEFLAVVESLRKCKIEKEEIEADLLRVENLQRQQILDSTTGTAKLKAEIERLLNTEKLLKASLERAENDAKHCQTEGLQSATQIEELQLSQQQANRDLKTCREEVSQWQAVNLKLKAEIDLLHISDQQLKEALMGAGEELEFWQAENAQLRAELERKQISEQEQKEDFQAALEAAQTSLMEGTTALEQAQVC